MKLTPLFYHPDQDVVFDFISTKKVPEFVRQSGRSYVIPELLTAKDFYAVHDVQYVDAVLSGQMHNGFSNRNADVNRSIVASNSNFVAAAEHALESGIACSATQGFHHAHFDHNYGYCTFNGLMLAAARLIDKHDSVNKVLILDGDGHHGDGTDDIIEKLDMGSSVVNVTRHQFVQVPEGAMASAWAHFADILIEEHRPDIIMYQAGADAWDGDPYGAGYLDLLGMMRRDTGIFHAAKTARIPLVFNLAGGYSTPMQKVIDIHLETLIIADRVYANGTI